MVKWCGKLLLQKRAQRMVLSGTQSKLFERWGLCSHEKFGEVMVYYCECANCVMGRLIFFLFLLFCVFSPELFWGISVLYFIYLTLLMVKRSFFALNKIFIKQQNTVFVFANGMRPNIWTNQKSTVHIAPHQRWLRSFFGFKEIIESI